MWALQDPSRLAEGISDPDEDRDLVESHENTAGNYLRRMAHLDAVRMILGDERFEQVEDKLLHPTDLSYERLTRDTGDQAVWAHVAERWHSLGSLALIAPVDPDAPPLPSDLANYLRKRTMTLLVQPKSAIGDVAQVVVERYASGHAADEASWNLLTDGVITGYCLRRGEEELSDHYVLDDGLRTSLVATAKTEPNRAVEEGVSAALPVIHTLFSGDRESWDALRAWAGQETVTRSVERRNAGIESGDEELTHSDAARAFDFGYVVRAVETAIYGEEAAGAA
jgi:hypothetical protein